MEYSVVIVASGKGERMKLGYNKVFYQLNDGRTILEHTIACFRLDSDCKQIVVVTNEENIDLVRKYGVECMIGGSLRQDSVNNGLSIVQYPYVMIHDGARPRLKLEVLNRLKEKVVETDACLLMIPCKDTIKEVVNGVCQKTLDRNILFQAQTPQAFKTELLRDAFSMIMDNEVFTDDAAIVENKLNLSVHMVLGDEENIKVTTLNDLKNLG